MDRRRFLYGASVFSMAFSAAVLPAPPNIAQAGTDRSRWQDYFPNFLLQTHEGKTVRFFDDLIREKTVVINLIFTSCPPECLPTTANLVQVQKALGDRVGRNIFMYSITVDPERDTPAVLKKYAKKHGIEPGWLFLTGKPEEITLLRRKLGFYKTDPDDDAKKEGHIGKLRIGNEARSLWMVHNAMGKPHSIIKAINLVDPSVAS